MEHGPLQRKDSCLKSGIFNFQPTLSPEMTKFADVVPTAAAVASFSARTDVPPYAVAAMELALALQQTPVAVLTTTRQGLIDLAESKGVAGPSHP